VDRKGPWLLLLLLLFAMDERAQRLLLHTAARSNRLPQGGAVYELRPVATTRHRLNTLLLKSMILLLMLLLLLLL
jgi:hypothetical protein